MRNYYLVETINNKTGVIVDLKVCLSQQEVNEVKVAFNQEKFIIPCDKRTALKSLKNFRKKA
jgi:hypothetical protein